MNVYSILFESGVIASGQDFRQTDVFKRSLELGLISNPEARDLTAPVIDANTPTSERLLQINGMWCTSCSWLVERALRSLPGVVSAEVFFASDLAKVRFCPQYLPPDKVTNAIERLGYKVSEYSGETETANAETRDLLLRLGVSAFLWSNIMAISTILYVGYFEEIARSASHILPYVLFGLTTPLIFYCAFPILRAAFAGFRSHQIRMETLLSLGILTAYGYSAAQAFRGETHVYFDTAAAIVTLVLTGKLIEKAAKQRAAKSISSLYRLMPRKVRMIAGGVEHFVSIDALRPGEEFVLKSGERVPADGVVTSGETYVDESLLTGESTPIMKRVGDTVISGSLNTGGVVHARATKVGSESALAQIIKLVEQALSSRAGIARTVDRVARIFVPCVIVASLATLAFGLATHVAVTESVMRAISVLVIACPCALGLATPLAITAAVGSASQRGILISNSQMLETVRRLDVVVFDKTGTVTDGKFELLDYCVEAEVRETIAVACVADSTRASAHNLEREHFEQKCLPILAALELYSEHPLGTSVVERARKLGVSHLEAAEVNIHKGAGITGRVQGRLVCIGNRRFANAQLGDVPASIEQRVAEWQRAGHTVAYFGWDGHVKGALAFGDRIKPEAPEMVRQLQRHGLKVHLVSGDAEATTAFVAKQIGADEYIADALPNQKCVIIQDLQQKALCVAMVGDGVNDAPALAQADLGIALGTGTDVAMRAAPVVLMSNSLLKVIESFDLAERLSRIVRQNLFWAFFYNVLGISLALTGILTPIFAAGAMLLSSTSVVLNSMRLTRQAPEIQAKLLI